MIDDHLMFLFNESLYLNSSLHHNVHILMLWDQDDVEQKVKLLINYEDVATFVVAQQPLLLDFVPMNCLRRRKRHWMLLPTILHKILPVLHFGEWCMSIVILYIVRI